MGRVITIAGGGLAGLTLGILLRREHVPVEIWDAGCYPRHRVCGEFISGRGVELLKQLGVTDGLRGEIQESWTVRFYNSGRSTAVIPLPQAATAVSRATLDHLLATEFRRLGGVLHESRRWTGDFTAPGVVRATGRKLRKPVPGCRQLFGLKVHARNLPLESDLELHFSSRGYVGVSRLPRNEVNICALLADHSRSRNLREDCRAAFEALLTGKTRQALRDADLDFSSFSAVAGISLQRERAAGTAECRIGDSICMIPPLTGNGMSIALESAFIAAPFLADYSQRNREWDETRQRIARSCDARFKRRLFASSILQKLTSSATARAPILWSLRVVPSILRWGFFSTR